VLLLAIKQQQQECQSLLLPLHSWLPGKGALQVTDTYFQQRRDYRCSGQLLIGCCCAALTTAMKQQQQRQQQRQSLLLLRRLCCRQRLHAAGHEAAAAATATPCKEACM
jgi:hypothetical protein